MFVFCYEYNQNNNDGNENDKKYLAYSELLLQAKESGVGFWLEHQDTLYLVPCPVVRLNTSGVFHSDTASAIRWKDTEDEFYVLNGVTFPKALWQEVVSRKMPFEKILAITDIDQRTQAMRYGDVEKFLEHTKAKLLDEHKKTSLSGKVIRYRLFEIPIEPSKVFTETAYYVVYDCRITDRVYMKGVPNDKKTVAEAMAWGMSSDENILSPEMWKQLVPALHEI